jgi:hypothetical protein
LERGKQLAVDLAVGMGFDIESDVLVAAEHLDLDPGGFLGNLEAGEMVFTGKALSPARDVRSELVSRQVSQSYSW